MVVVWVVVPCSLLVVCQHFRGTCCFHLQGEVNRGMKLMGYIGLCGGLGQEHGKIFQSEKLEGDGGWNSSGVLYPTK